MICAFYSKVSRLRKLGTRKNYVLKQLDGINTSARYCSWPDVRRYEFPISMLMEARDTPFRRLVVDITQ